MSDGRFDRIKDELRARIDSFVPSLLRAARRNGNYFLIGDVDGNPGKSLFVVRRGAGAGHWEDRAAGQKGSPIDLIMAHLRCDLPRAMEWAEDWLGLDKVGMAPRPRPQRPAVKLSPELDDDDAQRMLAACEIWRAAAPAGGTLVERYLRSRAITIPVPPSLRFAERLSHRPSRGSYPAMIAALQAPDRTVTAVQRTWLAPDGAGKAQVDQPKLGLGPMQAGAVRLAAAGRVLGLAEGIETALSAMQIFSLPVWATLSCGRFSSIALPDQVEHVIIFADNDKPSLAAAEKAVDHYRAQGVNVDIEEPEGVKDWNDHLQARAGRRAA